MENKAHAKRGVSKDSLYLTEIFVLVGVFLFLSILKVDILLILATEMFVVLFFVCFEDISSNIFFFFFLVSFFIFLLSGDLAEAIFKRYYYIQFDDDADRHSWLAIFISLIGVFAGYKFTKHGKTRFAIGADDNTKTGMYRIRKASKIVFFVTLGVAIFNTLDAIIYVSANGYVAYYKSYSPLLPSLIYEIGGFAPIALCVFYATFPTKEECKLPTLAFLFQAGLTFIVGARGNLIFTILMLLAYYIMRGYKDRGKVVWISKRSIIFLCAAVPFVLVFLFLYDFIRGGREIEYSSFFDTFIDFFVNIGASSKVIKYGYIHDAEIVGIRWFSLGETLNYLKYGVIYKVIAPLEIPATHSVEYAMKGHQFASYISYLAMPENYLRGEGTGSSFVAELYADLGYFGVALGSIIYGMVFKKLSNLKEDDWFGSTIKIYMFLSIIDAPRANYDGFIACFINVNFIFCLAIIYILAQSIKVKKNNSRISLANRQF